jgi:hypothetical protein
MLDAVGAEFASGEAYRAARAAGHDVTDRTLRSDLAAAEAAGIVQRTGATTWRKVRPPASPAADPVRLCIVAGLLAAGRWEEPNAFTGDGARYAGPEPEALAAAVERYAAALAPAVASSGDGAAPRGGT